MKPSNESDLISVNQNSEEFFFEGTEKLFEIWFESSEANDSDLFDENRDKARDLRKIDSCEWGRLLKSVNCEIISEKSNSTIVAYLLSESSMFVSKNRLILKTCGNITLLGIVKPMLKLVQERCGFDTIVDVYYSHKNYLRPDLQPLSHRKFDVEVDTLNELFEDGAAYAFGRINRDCWYLYTLDLIGIVQPDQTLELMMTEVSRDVMSMFYQSYGLTAEQLTKKSGIADLMPGAVIDSFLFDPCGYSMNAILPDACYFTIHITPEEKFSYASFETNAPKECYGDLIAAVLDLFKPEKVLMTLLANDDSVANGQELDGSTQYAGYKRVDHQLCEMKNYYLTYAQFRRCNRGVPAPPRPPQ